MSLVYDAIKALKLTKEEQDALRAFFINNPNKRTEAELLFSTLNDDEIVDLLKILLKSTEQHAVGQVDVSSLQRGMEELNLKMESGFRKVHHAMEASFFSSGTVNETDKGKEVREKGIEISFPLSVTTSTKARSPGKFSDPPNKNANTSASEKTIQDYFMSECDVIKNFGPIRNNLKLVVEDTRNSPVLGTRKPDFVFIPRDSNLNYLNVMAVGEVKKLTGTNFNNAQIGQAISFGEKLLQLQPRRSFVFVMLTDCIKINIYRVSRVVNYQNQFQYQYIASRPLEYNSNNDNGWKYLVTFMESSPSDLGWVEPSLKFGDSIVNLVRYIGMGRTSIVYEGKHGNVRVAVKIAKKVDYLHCFQRESNVLEELSTLNSPHIPKILFYNDDALVMTPLGEKINNLRKKDIRDIINTLRNAHSRGIIHRDLRKFNFLRNLDGLNDNIFIIDWGYSIKDSENNTTFAGALECMPDEVLESLISEGDIDYRPQIDLMCFVRSFYLMLHKPSLDRIPFDKDDNIKNRAQMLLNFWNNRGKSMVWDRIYLAIENLDYDELIREIEMLF